MQWVGGCSATSYFLGIIDSRFRELFSRQMALEEGVENAFDFPGFVPAYIRPLFCEGIGPFRWAALSGDPEDIYKTDQKVKELIPDNPHLHNWLDMARERIQFQGLPARICWVGLKDRERLGQAFNEMVKNGELKAPVVIGRDHLDSAGDHVVGLLYALRQAWGRAGS